ncbi:hypothetical protein KC323_g3 [Hortaea werneckii]|nr:hypothetical protein KC323_g3 [Hortaea werneckii]
MQHFLHSPFKKCLDGSPSLKSAYWICTVGDSASRPFKKKWVSPLPGPNFRLTSSNPFLACALSCVGDMNRCSAAPCISDVLGAAKRRFVTNSQLSVLCIVAILLTMRIPYHFELSSRTLRQITIPCKRRNVLTATPASVDNNDVFTGLPQFSERHNCHDKALKIVCSCTQRLGNENAVWNSGSFARGREQLSGRKRCILWNRQVDLPGLVVHVVFVLRMLENVLLRIEIHLIEHRGVSPRAEPLQTSASHRREEA